MRFDHVSIRIKDFAIYLGKSRNTAAKYYKSYLSALGKKPYQSLTIQDLSKLDDIDPSLVYKTIFK